MNNNKMSDELNIIELIKDIEDGQLTIDQIIKKHNITKYKYNKILKQGDLKKVYPQHIDNSNKRKPKNTKFKRMLSEGADKDASSFDIEGFKQDSKNGMKLSDLMKKYTLTLYQIRELRIRYDLKTQ
jgi:Mor family transcriptional regulator